MIHAPWEEIAEKDEAARRLAEARAPLAPGDGARLAASPYRIVPEHVPPADLHQESPDVWGFADTRFRVNERGHVELTGGRYPLGAAELPELLPWVRRTLDVPLDPEDVHPSAYPPRLPPPRANSGLAAELAGFLAPDQLSQGPEVRLRHGHGHTQEEMYEIKYGTPRRVPDLVVWPATEEEVARIVAAAARHGAGIVPFGGGTSVTEALRCPEREERAIVSVDLRRMCRIRWIDPVNRLASIEAGAVGRHIVAALARHGFTLGHEPDSIEFSTLGGWIATHASGMKKNRYGNIEELVQDLTVVGPAGTVERSACGPRESVGIDPRRFLFGSEGSLGIVTSAVVKIFPLPEVQKYGSILFHDFESGVAFLYELARERAQPASVRLADNLQFQFSMALKHRSVGWRAWKSKLEKWVVLSLKGFDPEKMTACTLVFEGTRREVAAQERAVYGIARRHGGMKAGAANGERGYQLTFSIAYIRDFVMRHWVLGESFETSVPWSRTLALCEAVKRRVHAEHAARGLPGQPFISGRVTQTYDTGVCVYFYLAFYYKGLADPTRAYNEIEAAAREEILKAGGSLSHHHGIGKIRRRFLPDILSPAGLAWARQAKQALDPGNLFASGNQLLDEENGGGTSGGAGPPRHTAAGTKGGGHG